MKKTVLSIAFGISTLALTACGGGGKDTLPSTSTFTIDPPAPTLIQIMPTSSVTGVHNVWTQDFSNEIKKELKASAINTPFVTIDGVANGTTLELAKLAQGLNTATLNLTTTATIDGQAHTVKIPETLRAYHQRNSIVLGIKFDGITVSGPNKNQTIGKDDELELEHLSGHTTKTLPTAGVFNYSGKSFDHDSEGSFDYAIDFAKKTGKGNIALDGKSITLDEAHIRNVSYRHTDYDGFGIDGDTSGINGRYTLGIFGDNAEEVAGFASLKGGGDIIFGGVKK